MGRYSYIPLEFEKLEEGSEREILLKKDTKDIYILDDYKVPVSITNYLHKEADLLKEGISIMEADINSLEIDYRKYVATAIEFGERLDELISKSEHEILNRIQELEYYEKYIQDYFQQINSEWEELKKNLNSIIDNYKADLSNILKMIQNKYNTANSLYENYYELYENYLSTLNTMETEITTLYKKLAGKMYKLGTGSGSFKGSITVSYQEVAECITWIFWLSNSTIYQPWTPVRKWTDPPRAVQSFGGGVWRPLSYPSDMTSSEAYTWFSSTFPGETTYIGSYWTTGVLLDAENCPAEFSSYLHNGRFVSGTPTRNRYAKQASNVYHKTRTVSYQESFTYKVT